MPVLSNEVQWWAIARTNDVSFRVMVDGHCLFIRCPPTVDGVAKAIEALYDKRAAIATEVITAYHTPPTPWEPKVKTAADPLAALRAKIAKLQEELDSDQGLGS